MRIVDIIVELPLNPKMKTVHLTLLLCLLLANSATGQYNSAAYFVRHTGDQLGTGQTDFSNYGLFPDANLLRNAGQESNVRMPSSGRTAGASTANSVGQFSQQSTGTSTSGQSSHTKQPAQTSVNQQSATTEDATLFASNAQVPQRNPYYADVSNGDSLNDNRNKYNRPYSEPTGAPYGIQSTGEILSFEPEKLDLSKCGPMPTKNPCTPFGSQYYSLPGYPHCYIHCAFGRLFVKPCPLYLVWNSRINSCDWPTVASPMSSDDYGATSYSNSGSKSGSSTYETTNTNYAMPPMYSYGRRKRSTVERKKRNIGGYYQSFTSPFTAYQYPGYYPTPLQYQSGPLHLPISSYNLPGPVSFPGQVGIASMPSQFANFQVPQPIGSPMAPLVSAPGAPTTPAPVPVAPTTQASMPAASGSQGFAPASQPRGMPSQDNLYPGLFSAPTNTNPAVVPAAPTAAAPANPPAVAQAAPSVAMTPSFFPTVPSTGYQFPMFSQQSVAPPTSFASPTPVSFQATLIPGPLYPYGPPHGGPFGRPFPPPPKPSPPPAFSPFNMHPMARYGLFGGYGGLQPFIPFGGPSHSSFRSFGGQQLPNAMPSNMFPFPPAMAFGNPFGNAPTDSNQPNDDPLGSDFELEVFPGDEDSSEDPDNGSNKGDGKIADKSKSPSNGADLDSSKKKDNMKNGNLKNCLNKEDVDYDDQAYNYLMNYPQINFRRKRQYGSYGTAPGQTPTVPVAQLSQPRVVSNDLLRQLQLSPCFNKPPISNIAHPTDSGKYIACLTRLQYIIMDCPSGLIYNPTLDQCEKKKNPDSICEREQPCMNNGQCYQTSSTTFKCACNGPWTGERCETPLSSCVNNPCGSGNECLTLKTGEYKQDYVCVCEEGQSYGLSCGRNTVPNPCLGATSEQEQYYPFVFSPQAFIQCNGDILYVQPCASGLYWNQEEKVCDRIEISATTQGKSQPSSYEITYESNEPQTTNILPTQNSSGQTVIKQQTYQEHFQETNQPHTVTREQSSTVVKETGPVPLQPTFRPFFPMFPHHSKSKPPMPTNNYVMAQEQPIISSRSLWSAPAIQSETDYTYPPKPQYSKVYYEPPLSPQISAGQRPITPQLKP